MGKLSIKLAKIMSSSILLEGDQLIINASKFIFKDHSFLNREMILDMLAINRDKEIVVCLFDGENLIDSNFLVFLRKAMKDLGMSKLSFMNRDPDSIHDFTNTNLEMGLFANVWRHIKPRQILPNNDAKLLGLLVGRYNINRFRLAFELDREFIGDNFIIWQPNKQFVIDTVKPFGSHYDHMLNWMISKEFDNDLKSDNIAGTLPHEKTYGSYTDISQRYLIEIISETDSLGNHWFTEKTARCLAIGKPFILISGRHSLRRLRAWGFETMGDLLDESYDNLHNPTVRIKAALQSMKNFDRSKYIDLLEIAKINIERYESFSRKHHSKPPNKYPYEDH